jgi:hypothetical protein
MRISSFSAAVYSDLGQAGKYNERGKGNKGKDDEYEKCEKWGVDLKTTF